MNSLSHNNSIIGRKSYAFALEIIKLYKYLTAEKKDYILSKQIVWSGTSIGANINEALSSESKRDFIHKLAIALKEAKETIYWLSLLYGSDYINKELFEKLFNLCNELFKILSSIIITTKQRYLNKNA